MVLVQGHSKGGAYGVAAMGSKIQGAVKWAAKYILHMKNIYFLLLTNLKSISQIGGKSINNCDYCNVCNFLYGWPL
jgi:hypothetical protein